jgi:hypothetical protein
MVDPVRENNVSLRHLLQEVIDLLPDGTRKRWLAAAHEFTDGLLCVSSLLDDISGHGGSPVSPILLAARATGEDSFVDN